jgi:hypothetical protein
MADRQVPIWRSIRKEFLHNLQHGAKVIKRRNGREDEAPQKDPDSMP